MSEQEKPTTAKVYESKVLLEWETDENAKKIVFPKKNCICRKCPFADYQILEREPAPNDEQDEQPQETTPILECVCYCHDRYREVFGNGLPNIVACDGFYKQPKE